MTKQEQKAIKALEKEFKKLREDLQEKAEFFNDTSNQDAYTWKFKIEGSIIEYKYLFETGEVTKRFA